MTGSVIVTVIIVVYGLGYCGALVVNRLSAPGPFTLIGRRRTASQRRKAQLAALAWPLALYRLARPAAPTQDHRQLPPPKSADSSEGEGLDIPRYGVIDETDD